MKQKLSLLYAMFMVLSFHLCAQSDFKVTQQQYTGETGVRKKISELTTAPSALRTTEVKKQLLMKKPEFDLSEFKKFKEKIGTGDADIKNLREADTLEEPTTAAPATSSLAIPFRSPFDVWSNFLAGTFSENAVWPPDPNGAVGTSQVVVLSNGGIKVFEKRSVTDAPLVTPKGMSNTPAPSQLFIPLDLFFSPVLRANAFTSDPHVRFDRLTKRWFVVAIDVDPALKTTNYILLAVSDGERITNASSFTYFKIPSALFKYNTTIPIKPFLDYPTLGVDKNAALIGGSFFFSNSNGFADSIYSVAYAINKNLLLKGSLSLTALQLGILTNTTFGGMYVPQGVHNDDPTTSRSYFAGISFLQNSLRLAGLNYSTAGQVISLSSFSVPVEDFQFPRDVTAPGSPMPIDPLDTRLFAAEIRKNKITGKSSLWTAHVIGVNQAGHYVPDSLFVAQARTASRWYEVGNVYTTPTLTQLGTLFDPTRVSGRRAINFFNSSIAANGQGHGALGGTTAAFNRYLNVFVAGRSNTHAPGALSIPEKTTNTRAIYAPYFDGYGYIGRWGDFSQTSVDPLDDQTVWTFQEYANADDSWGVRAVQLKAPPPATPIPFAPLTNKTDNVVTLNGISIDNSGFFDPGTDAGGPGYNRLTVKSTGGIIAGNVKFISPTQISFTLNTKGKPSGVYTLLVTNPDGQFVITQYLVSSRVQAVMSSAAALTQAALDQLKQAFIKGSNVYPNPTNDNLTVQVDAAKAYNGKIVLLDLTGRRLAEHSYNFIKGNNVAELSLGSYSKGSYIVAVFNADNVLVAQHKVVKE
jgi:hypothetical protein